MRIEIRNNSVILDGYVNAVGRTSRELYSPRGKFVEEIKPKTFQRALMKTDNVDLLFNHDRSRKLGSLRDKNLELREDNIGLRAIATVTDEQVIEKAKAGELRGWSFGFAVNKDTWLDGENGIQKRMVEDIDLYEVSVLDQTPAYIATSIEARGESEILVESRVEDFEANIEDNSVLQENDKKVDDEKRQAIDYSMLEQELTILQMKGSLNK